MMLSPGNLPLSWRSTWSNVVTTVAILGKRFTEPPIFLCRKSLSEKEQLGVPPEYNFYHLVIYYLFITRYFRSFKSIPRYFSTIWNAVAGHRRLHDSHSDVHLTSVNPSFGLEFRIKIMYTDGERCLCYQHVDWPETQSEVWQTC